MSPMKCPSAKVYVQHWEPLSAIGVRFLLCGHVNDLSQVDVRHALISLEDGCPTCGNRSSTPEFRAKNFVPPKNFRWENAECTEMHAYPELEQQLSPTCTLEDFLSWLSTGASYSLENATLRPDNELEKHETDAFLVWRAFAGGSTAKNGTIVLPMDSVVLLEGAGVHFQDITFSGGNLVCAGWHFNATFTACTFRNCGLYAVHGAALTLRGCTITDSPQPVIAHGPGTVVTAAACTFSQCTTVLIVESGASVHAASCEVDGAKVAAIVHGFGSHVAMDDVRMHGAHGQAAVMVQAGSARLRRCDIARFEDGVIVSEVVSAVEMDDTHARGRRVGVMLLRRARGTLRRVSLQYAAKSGAPRGASSAVQVGGVGPVLAGGCVQMERCAAVTGIPESPCMQVLERARASLRACRLECSTVGVQMTAVDAHTVLSHCVGRCGDGACWALAAGASAWLRGCSFESPRSVVKAAKGAKITVVDCELRGCDAPQLDGLVSVVKGGEVRVLRGSIRGGTTGIAVNHGRVIVIDTVVADMAPTLLPGSVEMGAALKTQLTLVGVAFGCLGGSLHVRGGTVRGCLLGVFADMDDEYPMIAPACVLSFDSVVFQGCMNGVHVMRSRAADLIQVSGCTFGRELYSGPRTRAGRLSCPTFATLVSDPSAIYLPAAHSSVIRDSVFECATPGIVANKLGTSLQVAGCKFGHGGSGERAVVALEVSVTTCVTACTFSGADVYVLASGTCTLSDCEFAPKALTAVHACGAGSLALEHCCFHGCDQGVRVSRGSVGEARTRTARLQVRDCEFADVRESLVVQDVSCVVTATKLSITGGDTGCIAGAKTPGQHTELTFIDCVLRGMGTGMHLRDAGVRAEMRECDFEGCDTAVAARGAAAARLHVCAIRACGTGVAVGDAVGGEGERFRCPVCGCGAMGAATQAWRARTDVEGGGPVEVGAACVHRGALAQMALKVVTIDSCTDAGVDVTAGGHAVASDVTVLCCRIGVRECFVGERSEFSRCVVVPGTVGGRPAPAVLCERLTKAESGAVKVQATNMGGVQITQEAGEG